MAKPFDAATKYLLEMQPEAWVRFLRLSGSDVHVVDADLATVTADADRVLYIGMPKPYILHIEFQASYDAEMAERLLRYNVLLRYRHRLPVHSVVVLLRKQADGASLTGTLEYFHPETTEETQWPPALSFRYNVVRVWDMSPDIFLAGDLGILPFAPIAAAENVNLPSIIQKMESRIQTEVSASHAGILWASTFVLMGLKFSPELTHTLLKEIKGMEESATYQEIISKGFVRGHIKGFGEGRGQGRLEGERELLIRFARKRLGEPSPEVKAAIEAITSEDHLNTLADRIEQVESWEELLA